MKLLQHITILLLLQVKNIIYHTMKDVVGILTNKLPVTKATKAAKSSPPKLNSHKTAVGAMATEVNNNKLSTSVISP